jgi:hypothetical protein
MFDKSKYLRVVEHKACQLGIIEASTVTAYKIDDSDGIAQAIGFHSGMINKVDYFSEHQSMVLLIELSDLDESITKCLTSIQKSIHEWKLLNGKITKKEENEIRKEAWKDIKVEFCKKWSGSIAVIERLYRKTNEPNHNDPKYKLLVVCKNKTEVQMFESLKIQLNGMMGTVEVCNTQTLEKFVAGNT